MLITFVTAMGDASRERSQYANACWLEKFSFAENSCASKLQQQNGYGRMDQSVYFGMPNMQNPFGFWLWIQQFSGSDECSTVKILATTYRSVGLTDRETIPTCCDNQEDISERPPQDRFEVGNMLICYVKFNSGYMAGKEPLNSN